MSSKLTELAELTIPTDDDVFYIVDDPGGSPVGKKITHVNLLESIFKIGGGVSGGTAGSALFIDSSGNLGQDNSNFFYNDSLNRLMVGQNTTFESTPGLDITGNLDITHVAEESDDHALEIDVDAAAFGDVKGLDIFYDTGALATGSDEESILVQFDEFDAAGGDLTGIEVLATEGGADKITAVFAGALVGPIEQLSGTFADMDSALVNASNERTDLINSSADTNIFVADTDTVTIGDGAKFEELEFILTTGSSGAGIKPKFEFSTGVDAWTEFNPADGTNAMRNNGVIVWLDSELVGWAVGTGTEFLIRITRQRSSLTTTPVAKKVQISAATEYFWDKNGDVSIKSLTASPGAAEIGIILQGAASQSANLLEAKISSGDLKATINENGDFTNSQGGLAGEAFGDGATVDGDNRQVALGFNASAIGTESIALGANTVANQGGLAIGSSASVTGFQGVAIGQGSTAGVSGFGFGASSAAGSQGVCIGVSTSATFGVAIGHKAKTTANFQFVVGGTGGGGSNVIKDVYIGEGVESATAVNVTFHATRGLGTNIAGGNYTIAPGESTGNATPSSIIFQGTTAGASGSTVQTLVDIVTITDGTISASQGFTGTEVFGAGSVNTAGTDNTIVGGGSTNTIGDNNTIIGADSISISGSDNTLVGANISVTQSSGVAGSTAIGEGITIDNQGHSIAIGTDLSITGVGFGAIAIGTGVSTTGTGFAIGRNSTQAATSSMTIGHQSQCINSTSIAIGVSCSVTGKDSVAIGFASEVEGVLESIALGARSVATASQQIVMGTDYKFSGGAFYTDMHLGAGEAMHPAATGFRVVRDFTIHASNASETDTSGWNLRLVGGVATGNATPSTVIIRGTVAGATGTTPQTVSDIVTFTNANTITFSDAVDFVFNATAGTKIGTATTQKIGFYNATPIVQPTEITDELTTITHTAAGTPDFAVQDLVDSGVGSAFGFATKDEGNTVLSVIANLQARVNELEDTLSSLGLVADAD